MLHGVEDFVVLKSGHNLVTFGASSPSNAQNLLTNLSTRLNQPVITDLNQLQSSDLLFEQAIFKVISPDSTLAILPQSRIWLIGNNFQEADLVSSPIDFSSDFWVLSSNRYPETLSAPNQGVFLISDNNPSKKLKTFATNNDLPLISIKDTLGFRLKLKQNPELLTYQ